MIYVPQKTLAAYPTAPRSMNEREIRTYCFVIFELRVKVDIENAFVRKGRHHMQFYVE